LKSKILFPYLETFISFVKTICLQYFQTRFLDEAEKFLASLEIKAARKIIYNIDLAEHTNDPRLFKNYKMIFGSLEQILVVNK